MRALKFHSKSLLAVLTLSAALPQAQSASLTTAPPPAAMVSGLAQAPSQVQTFTLDNGMTVIVQPDKRAPTVVHMLWVRVGAMDEVDGTSGVAHVLEHMMFKGTPDLKPGEFSRRVAALGGRENAFTSTDFTAYYQQVPAARLEQVMQLESDRFARNQWADEEFAREIEVIKEERRQRVEEQPRARMMEALNAAAFQSSPYRRPIIGWMSDLHAMVPQDVREFHQRWYTPANAALVIVGDVDPQQALALAKTHYGPIKARPVPPRKPRQEPEQMGPRRVQYHARAEQSVVVLAFKAPSWTEGSEQDRQDALALAVLTSVLDGYSGARLERALVQGGPRGAQRVADGADSSYGVYGRGPQLFLLSAVPASGVSPERAGAALQAEIARIAREGISAAELQRVKTQWAAGEIYKRDSVFNQAYELGNYWVNGLDMHTGERLMQALLGVSAAQVQSVAQRYFVQDKLTTAVLVPDHKAAAPATASQPPSPSPVAPRAY